MIDINTNETSSGTTSSLTISNIQPDSKPSSVDIQGNAFTWNQLLNGYFTYNHSANGITFTRGTGNIVHVSGTCTGTIYQQLTNNIKSVANHKYALITIGSVVDAYFYNDGGGLTTKNATEVVQTATASNTFYFRVGSGAVLDSDFSLLLYDLTMMFGVGNEPTTIEAFKATTQYTTMQGLNLVSKYDKGSVQTTCGKGIIWNQAINPDYYSTQTLAQVTFTKNAINNSITLSGTSNSALNYNVSWTPNWLKLISGHTYYFGDVTNATATNNSAAFIIRDNGTGTVIKTLTFGSSQKESIFTPASDYNNVHTYINIASGITLSGTITPLLIDLTVMYGLRNEPASIADFKASPEYLAVVSKGKETSYSVGDVYYNSFNLTQSDNTNAQSYTYSNILQNVGVVKAGNTYDSVSISNTSSVSRKLGVVDLGSLTYVDARGEGRFYTVDLQSTIYKESGGTNLICPLFTAAPSYRTTCGMWLSSAGNISFNYSGYENMTAAQFKAAMSGILLYYELETPATETFQGFTFQNLYNPTTQFTTNDVAESSMTINWLNNMNDVFRTAAKSHASNPIGKLIINNDEYGSSVLQSFTIKQCGCTSDEFTIGSVVASELSFSVLSSEADDITHGSVVIPYLGYKVQGTSTPAIVGSATIGATIVGSTQQRSITQDLYIQRGKFYVDGSQTKKNGLFTNFVAYDILMSDTFSAPFSATLTPYSTSATPHTNISTFLNTLDVDYDLTNVPTTGYSPIFVTEEITNRDALSRMAVACGANVMTNHLGEIAFWYPTKIIQETITPSLYNSITVEPEDYTSIDFISAEFSEEETKYYPSLYSGTGLGFDATYFDVSPYVGSTDPKQDALQTVYNRMVGGRNTVDYISHSIDILGCPYIEPFDYIQVVDLDNTTTYNVNPLSVTTKYTGGITVSIEATAIQQESNESTSTDNKVTIATRESEKAITTVTQMVTARYGTCNTLAATQQKDVVLPDFNLFEGCTISVKFTYANQSTSTTMSVNGSGAYPIYVNNKQLKQGDVNNWAANDIVDFLYSNGKWYIIGSNVAKYFGFNDGVLRVAQNDDRSGFHVDIGADSITLNNGNTTALAIQTSGITIGANSKQQMTLDDEGITLNTVTTEGNSTATLTAVGLTNTQSNQQSSIFFNDEATDTTQIGWIKRANGHLTLKVVG